MQTSAPPLAAMTPPSASAAHASTPDLGAQRAIVLGGSMAGLLTARVLAERFGEVVVLERDELPSDAAPRKGTPQALHPHGLLARGREIIEGLFPGFTDALVTQGALVGDLGTSVAFQTDGEAFATQRVGHVGLAASRLAIEAELRRRVRALPNVRVIDGAQVVEPRHAHGRVDGVAWRLAGEDGAIGMQVLPAALVVDCLGRASRTPVWLAQWGYAAPREERVHVGIAYVSAYFERSLDVKPQHAAAICAVTPERAWPGVLIAQEADDAGRGRWVVGVGGYRDDHPVCDRPGLLDRARRIGNADIVALAESGHMLGAPMRYHFPYSLRRRYERLARFPEGYLVLGDALTSFNPIYGQGMTVAACESLVLRDVLSLAPARRARAFFRGAAKAIDIPWQLAVGSDLALPQVPGPRPLAVRLVNAYVARLYAAAKVDAEVAAAFLKVVHLVRAPQTLFAPKIAWRVWRHGGAPATSRLAPRASAVA